MNDKKITVAIDGWSSSGKSTMARSLARAVGYRYVDTGAMYRAVTLWGMRHGLVSAEGVDAEALTAAMPQISIDFTPDTGSGQQTLLNGENVEREIRGMEVSGLVSAVAAVPGVRRALVGLQQRMGEGKGIVMDGRDIATVVFPDAELKIFVDAPAETRARRRLLEMQAKGMDAGSYEAVLANVKERDHIDSTRSDSPLRCAPDARRLDNSNLTPAEQDALLLDWFNEALANANR